MISQTSTGKIRTKLRFFNGDFNNILIIKKGQKKVNKTNKILKMQNACIWIDSPLHIVNS